MFSNNHYNKNLKQYSRENRSNSTIGERILWKYLKKRQINNLKFLRQRPMDKYIVDFFQPDLKLIIEIDGPSHDEIRWKYNQEREEKLK